MLFWFIILAGVFLPGVFLSSAIAFACYKAHAPVVIAQDGKPRPIRPFRDLVPSLFLLAPA